MLIIFLYILKSFCLENGTCSYFKMECIFNVICILEKTQPTMMLGEWWVGSSFNREKTEASSLKLKRRANSGFSDSLPPLPSSPPPSFLKKSIPFPKNPSPYHDKLLLSFPKGTGLTSPSPLDSPLGERPGCFSSRFG